MKGQVEQTAVEHQEASRAMLEASQRMNEFMEYQKDIKKKVQHEGFIRASLRDSHYSECSTIHW